MPENRAGTEREQVPEPHPGVVPQTARRSRSRKAQTTDTTPVVVAEAMTSTKKEEPMTTTTPTAAELSRLALAEAEATRTEALALADERKTAAEDLRTFLTSGQASLSELDAYADQWSRAQAAEQMATLLAEGADASVKRATAGLINDDTTVADLFADVVTEVYGGRLPVRVVTVPTDVKPNDNGDPVLFILQQKAGTNSAGILSATLELTFYRPPLFAPLDGTKIEEACRERNYAVEVGMWSTIDHGERCEDPARVKVARIFPTVPTLAHAPGDGTVSGYVNVVRNSLRNAVTHYGEREGVRLMGEPVEGAATAETVSHRVVSQSQNKGDHRLTIEAVYKVRPDSMLLGAPIGGMLKEAVNKEVGTMAEGLGRIVAVDHLAVDVPDLSRRFGDGDPFVVTAHIGVMYRLG
jgi:hypothetical protein